MKEEEKQTDIKEKKELYEKKKESTTLKEIDLNILADKEHTWETDAQGNFVIP